MRCLALALELRTRGWVCWFASRSLPDNLIGLLDRHGFPVAVLPADSDGEVGRLDQETGGHFDWLVLDHYELGGKWFDEAAAPGSRRLAIDDLGNRYLGAHLLVDSNWGVAPEKYSGKLLSDAKLLLGTRFVPIRPEFARARSLGGRRFGEVKRVLVSLGGGDPKRVTAKVVKAVRTALPQCEVDVVLGPVATQADEWQGEDRVHLHRAVKDMTPLLMGSDLAIGGGGGSAWERCLLGLPSILISLSMDQTAVAAAIDERGAACFAGCWETLPEERLIQLVIGLAQDVERREQMGRIGQALVDGQGASRIAHQLDGVRMRRVTPDDERLIWEWANDPQTRANSFSPQPIPLETHRQWFRRYLTDRDCCLLVGETNAGPIGQVRFDLVGGDADIDIAVAPEKRGGLGRLLLEAAMAYFVQAFPGVSLKARIRANNVSSLRIFSQVGFQVVLESEDVIEMRQDSPPGRPNGAR